MNYEAEKFAEIRVYVFWWSVQSGHFLYPNQLNGSLITIQVIQYVRP